ncbi:hypothetical protein ACFL11_00375 [Patescibacteria group bacterium]
MMQKNMRNSVALNLPVSVSFPDIKLSFKVFWIFTTFFLLLLLVFYIFQINSVISKSYQVQYYQERINDLSEENKVLELSVAQLNSWENIERQVQDFNFEKLGQIYYIQMLDSTVVSK